MSDRSQAGGFVSKLSPDEQIAELKAEVEELIHRRVGPAAEQIAAKSEEIAGQVRDYARQKTDAVASAVSHRPLTAIAIAAAVGFLIGRMR